MGGILGPIDQFPRVGVVVVELDAVAAFVPFGAAPAGGADAAAPVLGVFAAAGLSANDGLGAILGGLSALPDGAKWSWSLLNGGETFASKIANNAGEFDTPQKTGAYIAAGLVLFILTFVVNAIARIVIERRKAFTE